MVQDKGIPAMDASGGKAHAGKELSALEQRREAHVSGAEWGADMRCGLKACQGALGASGRVSSDGPRIGLDHRDHPVCPSHFKDEETEPREVTLHLSFSAS